MWITIKFVPDKSALSSLLCAVEGKRAIFIWVSRGNGPKLKDTTFFHDLSKWSIWRAHSGAVNLVVKRACMCCIVYTEMHVSKFQIRMSHVKKRYRRRRRKKRKEEDRRKQAENGRRITNDWLFPFSWLESCLPTPRKGNEKKTTNNGNTALRMQLAILNILICISAQTEEVLLSNYEWRSGVLFLYTFNGLTPPTGVESGHPSI